MPKLVEPVLTFGKHDLDLESPIATIPISIPEGQSSTAGLHLDLEHPSVSFRNSFVFRKFEESSSRVQPNRITSGLRSFTPSPAAQVSQEPPWSLFGQLMETDSLLQNLESPRLIRQRSRNNLEASFFSPFPENETDPFRDGDRPFVPSYARSNNRFAESPRPEQAQAEQPGDASTDYTSEASVDSTPALKSKIPTPCWFSLRQFPAIPILYRNIIKCAVAYFVASLFTFSPYLSGFISDITSYGSGERRPSPSGHMVATV